MTIIGQCIYCIIWGLKPAPCDIAGRLSLLVCAAVDAAHCGTCAFPANHVGYSQPWGMEHLLPTVTAPTCGAIASQQGRQARPTAKHDYTSHNWSVRHLPPQSPSASRDEWASWLMSDCTSHNTCRSLHTRAAMLSQPHGVQGHDNCIETAIISNIWHQLKCVVSRKSLSEQWMRLQGSHHKSQTLK